MSGGVRSDEELSVSPPSLDGEGAFPLSKHDDEDLDDQDQLRIKPPPVTVIYKKRESRKDSSRHSSRSRKDHGSRSRDHASHSRSRDRSRDARRHLEKEDRLLSTSWYPQEMEPRRRDGSRRDRDSGRSKEDLRRKLEGSRRVREGDRRDDRRRRRDRDRKKRRGRNDRDRRDRRRDDGRDRRSTQEVGEAREDHSRPSSRKKRRLEDEEDGARTGKMDRVDNLEPTKKEDQTESSSEDEDEEKEAEAEAEEKKAESETESSGSESDGQKDESGSDSSSESDEKEEEKHTKSDPAWKRDLMEHEGEDSSSEDSSSSEDEASEDGSEDSREDEKSPEVHEETPERDPTPPELRLPPYLPAIQGCRSVEEFETMNRIEEGTFGVVYRARDRRTGEIVALKRLKMENEKEGFPITSLREINTLLKAQHENIVTVREIVVGSNMDRIFIVMDYVEHDLKSLMETMKTKKAVFVFSEVKTLMLQLLRAIAHLHDNWIIHRDIKTSNLLLNHQGILKVADFGLAREYGSPLKAYTSVVVTLWYRAPELLLGAKEYSTPIDVWSVGCVFGELLLMDPMFRGKSEIEQLNVIFKDLGTPNKDVWPDCDQLPGMKKCNFPRHPYNSLHTRFSSVHLSAVGLNLLNKFLALDPKQRITADEALAHKWFEEEPLPKHPKEFPMWPAKSEFGHRKRGPKTPQAPSGGGQFKHLGDDDDKVLAKFGGAAAPGGFTLKF